MKELLYPGSQGMGPFVPFLVSRLGLLLASNRCLVGRAPSPFLFKGFLRLRPGLFFSRLDEGDFVVVDSPIFSYP